VAGFVIQTGDPTSRNGAGNPARWGQTGSSQTVPLEANAATVAEGHVHGVGYLGIARSSNPNSGSSQFFINLTDNSSLNGSYTVFGKVISGLEVAMAIGNLPVADTCRQTGGLACPPANPKDAMILSVTIQDSP
jgi:cyclophilin family peptidyl-prolyl cis-trans isomerase